MVFASVKEAVGAKLAAFTGGVFVPGVKFVKKSTCSAAEESLSDEHPSSRAQARAGMRVINAFLLRRTSSPSEGSSRSIPPPFARYPPGAAALMRNRIASR